MHKLAWSGHFVTKAGHSQANQSYILPTQTNSSNTLPHPSQWVQYLTPLKPINPIPYPIQASQSNPSPQIRQSVKYLTPPKAINPIPHPTTGKSVQHLTPPKPDNPIPYPIPASQPNTLPHSSQSIQCITPPKPMNPKPHPNQSSQSNTLLLSTNQSNTLPHPSKSIQFLTPSKPISPIPYPTQICRFSHLCPPPFFTPQLFFDWTTPQNNKCIYICVSMWILFCIYAPSPLPPTSALSYKTPLKKKNIYIHKGIYMERESEIAFILK